MRKHWLIFLGLFALTEKAAGECSSVSEKIATIGDSPVADFIVQIPASLWEIDSFVDVYKSGPECWQTLMRFAESEEASSRERVIAAYAMQSLRGEDYMSFVARSWALYRSGRLDKEYFRAAVLPGLEWNTYLQEHHAEPRVRAFLTEILESGLYDSDYLRATISGIQFESE